jgi:hypothetical protein
MRTAGHNLHRHPPLSTRLLSHRSRFRFFNASDESVPSTLQRLYITRLLSRIAQRLPQLLNRCVYAVIELDNRIIRPKPLSDFIAQDDLAGSLQEQ